MLDIMQRGGEFMWVILACSIIGLALVLERAYVFWIRYRLNPDHFFNEIMSYLSDGHFSRAIEACNVEAGKPLPEVIKAGLLKANEPDKDIQRAMESATLKAVPSVTKRMGYLPMLGNVATLLGLLGTIMGLIESFRGVAAADAAAKQDILSKGIAVAMFTTAFGLIAAIFIIVCHSVLHTRQTGILTSIEDKGTELFNYLSERNRKMRRSSESGR
jgi:biopolymer transport protein ExbB